MKGKQYYPVMIEWADACGEPGWHDMDEVQASTAMGVRSVGYLVAETKDDVVLASGISADGQVLGYIAIPRAWVKRKMRLRAQGR